MEVYGASKASGAEGFERYIYSDCAEDGTVAKTVRTIDEVREMDLEVELTKNPEFFAWLKGFNSDWESEYSGNIKSLLLAWQAGYDAGYGQRAEDRF